jgi:hypothetical protein
MMTAGRPETDSGSTTKTARHDRAISSLGDLSINALA